MTIHPQPTSNEKLSGRPVVRPPISKRLFDLLLTSLMLVLISPLLAALALLMLIYHGTPILFRQQRPGYHGKPFSIFKFRTMTNDRDQQGNLLPDEQRLTRLGKFLRQTSLDELPELFNVLRGEMSWVGPRPLLMQYLPRYSPEQARRHDVLPGITGWAQINGRNTLNWEDRFRYDVWYVDHWSFWLDIKILALTFWKVLRREGINPIGKATMEEFMGSQGQTAAQFWQAFCQQNPPISPETPYQTWYFGDSRELADELGALVLAGKKTATATLAWSIEADPADAPILGGYSVITDFDGNPQCIIQTSEVRTLPFDEVDAQFAAEEGEGDLSLEYWRQAHWRFFSRCCEKLGCQPDPKMPVVCERFRLVYSPRENNWRDFTTQ
ncbi:MAG: sugar transferase [Anaerolineales bacterium]|nr:sugar transferase [Anaerolineales bacterium]